MKHRILEHGEIIQAGDEYDASARWNDDAKWKPIPEHMIGKPASDPQYPAHTLIRRMVEPVQKCDHSKLVDGEVCKCGASHRVLQQPVPQDER